MTQLPIHLEDRVRAVAHSLWLEEGMPDGRAETHWFKALELVNAEAAEAAGTAEVVTKPTRKAPVKAAAAKKPAARKSTKA